MKALIFENFGNPAEVLQLREVPMPQPQQGEVRVQLIASPLNPSDLLMVRGEYGRLPSLPASAGFEGVGVVNAAGPGFLGWLRKGRRVVVLNSQGGNWQEQVIVSARQVVPIADIIPDDQAALFFVNPASALAMTRYVLRLRPGDWLLQTAAGSALGKMIIRLGRHYGFRTINVVRRREQAEELRRLGDAAISTDDESLEDCVKKLTGGKGVLFALDAVGGHIGAAVVRSLAPGGRMVVYGNLSREPIPVEPRILLTGHRTIQGFWLSLWARQQGVIPMLRLFRQIARLLEEGVLTSRIRATFPLAAIREAVLEAEKPGHEGKVLLQMGPKMEHVAAH